MHADIGEGITADQAVVADEPEHTGEHLVTAGAVVRVEEDDFIRFVAVDLAGVAKADHVLGEFAAVLVTHAGLAHHERLKTFSAQLGEYRRGGDVAVALGPAFMRGIRKDRRCHCADLVIGQRAIGAQDR
ncbi:hypothetical protein D9M69_506300 [compost metagenome]